MSGAGDGVRNATETKTPTGKWGQANTVLTWCSRKDALIYECCCNLHH